VGAELNGRQRGEVAAAAVEAAIDADNSHHHQRMKVGRELQACQRRRRSE